MLNIWTEAYEKKYRIFFCHDIWREHKWELEYYYVKLIIILYTALPKFWSHLAHNFVYHFFIMYLFWIDIVSTKSFFDQQCPHIELKIDCATATRFFFCMESSLWIFQCCPTDGYTNCLMALASTSSNPPFFSASQANARHSPSADLMLDRRRRRRANVSRLLGCLFFGGNASSAIKFDFNWVVMRVQSIEVRDISVTRWVSDRNDRVCDTAHTRRPLRINPDQWNADVERFCSNISRSRKRDAWYPLWLSY